MKIIDNFLYLFNQAWFGSFIGIFGAVSGFILYKKSIRVMKISYRHHAIRLLGYADQKLSSSIKIYYKDNLVPRLGSHTFIIWNSGNVLIDGKNIVESDPLRISIPENSEILELTVLKINRPTNKVNFSPVPGKANEYYISFDYLNPNDGVVIELLHNGKFIERPKLLGSVKGLEEGATSNGRINPLLFLFMPFSYQAFGKLMLWLLLGCSVLLLTPSVIIIWPDSPKWLKDFFGNNKLELMFSIVTGILLLCITVICRFVSMPRYPKSLDCPDLNRMGFF